MSRGSRSINGRLADRSIDVRVSAPKLIAHGFRDFERRAVTLPEEKLKQQRDVLRVGPVVAVLPYDPAHDAIVVMRQFRLPAHIANGRGELIEIVAGHVEKGETAAYAASRECVEEIGLKPKRLVKLFTYLPTPGISDEEITLFVGVVDTTKLPARGGAATEHEVTMPFTVPVETALAELPKLRMRSGPLVLALHWLALNRSRLAEFAKKGRR